MNYKDIVKKQSFIIMISVIVMGVILLGTSFALFNDNKKSTNEQVITSGTFNLDFSTSEITPVTGTITPQSESEANVFTLKIKNNGNLQANYYVRFKTKDNNTLEHQYIKVKVDDFPTYTFAAVPKTKATKDETDPNKIEYNIGDARLDPNETVTHNIKVWIDENAPASIVGKTLSIDLSVVGIVADSEYLV